MTDISKIKRSIDRAILRSLGAFLNRNTGLYLSYKPDFERNFGNFSDFSGLSEKWTKKNFINNVGDYSRFYSIYLNGGHVLKDNVKGDIAELGVYRGNSAAILAKLAAEHGRRLFLFDTFTGFDERDYAGKNDTTNNCDFTDTSVDKVRSLLAPYEATFVKGFFPESLDRTALPSAFAIVHIDCDLAEPMKAGLETFYPLLSPGGIIILHDYGSGWWKALTKTVDKFFEDKPEKPTLMPDKSGTVIVRKHSLRGSG